MSIDEDDEQKLICTQCIRHDGFAQWIEENGTDGICSFDQEHTETKTVSLEDFGEQVDEFFQENYCIGERYPYVPPDSDRIDDGQYGEPFEEILRAELECDDDVLNDLCDFLKENDDYDPRDGGEPFYDDFMNYELVEAAEKRREQEMADYYYEIDASLEGADPAEKLESSLFFLGKLVEQTGTLDDVLQIFQWRMIFSFCITTLEAFLSDTFAKKVMSDDKIKEAYLKNEDRLSGRKVSLGELFERHRQIDTTIKDTMQSTSFHNLEYVKPLYGNVLGVDIGEIGDLMKLVNKRHDFVHRNGKDKDGNDVVTNKEEIIEMIELIHAFCMGVRNSLNPVDDDSMPF